jgi:hypothetical protein
VRHSFFSTAIALATDVSGRVLMLKNLFQKKKILQIKEKDDEHYCVQTIPQNTAYECV